MCVCVCVCVRARARKATNLPQGSGFICLCNCALSLQMFVNPCYMPGSLVTPGETVENHQLDPRANQRADPRQDLTLQLVGWYLLLRVSGPFMFLFVVRSSAQVISRKAFPLLLLSVHTPNPLPPFQFVPSCLRRISLCHNLN